MKPDRSYLAARRQLDAMGVEQILFNLVDNACKYAAPSSGPRAMWKPAKTVPKSRC